MIQTWIAGIECNDGMADTARIKWFGEMVRAWRTATRDALGLPDAPEPLTLASQPPRAF